MNNVDSVLWELRADKVIAELKNGKRVDARAFDEYRDIKIQKNISENAEGSARVLLGETDVIAGIKILPGTPFPDSPDMGSIGVGVELLPLASPSFEAGPPRSDSIELARVVDRAIREAKVLDFKKLCVKEGEQVWIVFIDLYALSFAGNLFDAFEIAAMSSLLEAKLPKLEDDKIVKGEFSGKLKVERKPILSTFAKIGNAVVLDPNLAEEKALNARFSVSTTEDDFMSAFQKGGSGSFSAKEIDESLDVAFKRGKQVRKLL